MSILVETFGTTPVDRGRSRRPCARCSTCARRDRPRPRPQAADLPGAPPPTATSAGPPDFTWEHASRLDDFKAAVGLSRAPSPGPLWHAGSSTVASPGSLPDVTGLDKEFDYSSPTGSRRVRVGTIGARAAARPARRRLGRRARPAGAAASTAAAPDRQGHRRGPAPELIELARWAAVRWAAGRLRPFLRRRPARRPRRRAATAARARARRSTPVARRRRRAARRPAAACCACRPTDDVDAGRRWPRSRSGRRWSSCRRSSGRGWMRVRAAAGRADGRASCPTSGRPRPAASTS